MICLILHIPVNVISNGIPTNFCRFGWCRIFFGRHCPDNRISHREMSFRVHINRLLTGWYTLCMLILSVTRQTNTSTIFALLIKIIACQDFFVYLISMQELSIARLVDKFTYQIIKILICLVTDRINMHRVYTRPLPNWLKFFLHIFHPKIWLKKNC